ncbi:MAG TPA: sulfite exporter TauE/SafE family protein [Candidatus Omnitrophota bacterium]|nr:sulfite exporter TauE/SafE family protein [Candidatus Omnitrophota bacterium]
MTDTLITYVQVFGIGFSFGVIGPCFLTCAPALLAYVAGTQKRLSLVVLDVSVFLCGRLFGYCILGAIAGLSGYAIRKISSPSVSLISGYIGGALSIVLGLAVLSGIRTSSSCSHMKIRQAYNFGGLFLFGLVIGVSPCAPLAALLVEIALISKSAVDGLIYAFFFGLGTFLSGLLVVGGAAGLFSRAPAHLIRSPKINTVFKIFCGMLLISFGVFMFLRSR